MQIKIRNNVFETNSSSMHSISMLDVDSTVYTKEDALSDIKISGEFIENNILRLDIFDEYRWNNDLNNFDWGPALYTDFFHKLMYCLIDLYHPGYNLDNDVNENFIRLVEWTKEFLGVDDVAFKIEDEEKEDAILFSDFDKNSAVTLDIGSIDHQSCGTTGGLTDNSITIAEFICDTKYVLIIDNDNH